MKVAICMAIYGDVKSQFMLSLAGLIIEAGKIADLTLCAVSSSSIASNREEAAQQALDQGNDFLLWCDTDQKFPPITLARLLAHTWKSQIVGCNYPRRTSPTGPTAMNLTADGPMPVYTTQDKAQRGLVEQVDFMGLGVCLMSAAVLQAIERPWFANDGGLAEDGYFFAKARAAGIRPLVDHRLSWEVGHIADRILTNADAEADRDRWNYKSNLPAP